MGLDVEAPDPPSLSGPQPRGEYDAIGVGEDEQSDDHRRAAVSAALDDGAWRDAFEEWAGNTFLDRETYETARERGLFERFDFYWYPRDDAVGYRAPPVDGEDADAFGDPGDVEEALDDLGRTVSEVLENDHLRREDDEFGFFPDEDEDREGEDAL